MREFSIYISGVEELPLPPLGPWVMAYLLFGAGLAWAGPLLHFYHLLFPRDKHGALIPLTDML
jgi:hypothetical protein